MSGTIHRICKVCGKVWFSLGKYTRVCKPCREQAKLLGE